MNNLHVHKTKTPSRTNGVKTKSYQETVTIHSGQKSSTYYHLT